jgi:hypothetical protein
LLLSNQNYSFIYKIEKFDYDTFVVFSNMHQLTHSGFSIFDCTTLRWAVKRGIKVKKLVKMCTYMTFDSIVPLEVMTYLDKIYRIMSLIKIWTNVYITCKPWIRKHIASDCFKKYWYFVFKNVVKVHVSVEKGLRLFWMFLILL